MIALVMQLGAAEVECPPYVSATQAHCTVSLELYAGHLLSYGQLVAV
jgi:hypothetical protein